MLETSDQPIRRTCQSPGAINHGKASTDEEDQKNHGTCVGHSSRDGDTSLEKADGTGDYRMVRSGHDNPPSNLLVGAPPVLARRQDVAQHSRHKDKANEECQWVWELEFQHR